MANTHDCKSWSHFFQAIKRGDKTHDLRYDADRNYAVGDTLNLREYDPFAGEYTGDSVLADVTFVTSSRTPCAFSSAVLPKDYCILSLRVRREQPLEPGKVRVAGATDLQNWRAGADTTHIQGGSIPEQPTAPRTNTSWRHGQRVRLLAKHRAVRAGVLQVADNEAALVQWDGSDKSEWVGYDQLEQL